MVGPNWICRDGGFAAQASWVFRPCKMGPDWSCTDLTEELVSTPPSQCGPTPRRLALRRTDIELLTYFDEDTSSFRDGYTSWTIAAPRLTRVRHVAGNNAHVAGYRKAAERRMPAPQSEYQYDTNAPNRQLEQTRLSIFSRNPGPRRGTPGDIDKHIAGIRHIIALQEAIEYLQHECLTEHFYATHFAGCAILFNKDTYHSDLQVSSVYIHDVKVRLGQH